MTDIEKCEEKLLAKLMDYLSYSSRTEKEVRDKAGYILRKMDLPEDADGKEILEKIVSVLKDENLVNDEEYARKYIEGLILSPKNKSIREASQFLYKKGVPNAIAEMVLSDMGGRLESKSLRLLVEKKAKTYGSLKNPVIRQKLTRYLVSKGYGYESVRSEIDKIASVK